MEQLNLTETGTNLTDQLNFTEYANIYKASGILHLLLVVIPVLLLGPLVLGLFISNKKLRDPSSILFMCITCVCIIGPSTYGLLMDISLITDYQILRSCEIGRMFWLLLFLHQYVLMYTISLLLVIQYIAIRWGKKKLPLKLTLSLFFTLTVLITILSFHSLVTEGTIQIRGFLCHATGSILLQGITGILLIIAATVIVGVFSCLTVKYLKKNVIQNKVVVRNIQVIMVAMITSIIVFRFLPIVNFVVQGPISTEEGAVVSWLLNYSSELSYPLFPILTLLVNKAVRKTLAEKIKAISCTSIKRRSNRVGPTLDAIKLYTSRSTSGD